MDTWYSWSKQTIAILHSATLHTNSLAPAMAASLFHSFSLLESPGTRHLVPAPRCTQATLFGCMAGFGCRPLQCHADPAYFHARALSTFLCLISCRPRRRIRASPGRAGSIQKSSLHSALGNDGVPARITQTQPALTHENRVKSPPPC